MMELINLIPTLGFPIVCVIGMAIFITKIWKQSVKREELLMQEITQNRLINQSCIETLQQYNTRLSNIESSINQINNKL